MDITWKKSPNYTENRNYKRIKTIVIHWIGMGTAESAANWFAKDSSNVSAHYIVGNDVLYQCVQEKDTAWHSGNWDMNLQSIGIEHEATPTKPMTEEIYKQSAELIADICSRHDIAIDREHIIGHNEVKATACPGTIDIDKLISMAKGDTVSKCEDELHEMRVSRNYWKQKTDDLEQTLGLEREENSNEIVSKQKIIDDQQKLISELQAKSLLDAKSYADMEKERTQWREAYIALEIQFNAYKTEKLQEIVNLSNKLADSEKKLEKCQVETKKMSLKDFIIIKYFKKG